MFVLLFLLSRRDNNDCFESRRKSANFCGPCSRAAAIRRSEWKVVGLLDNSKPNADKLEERFAQLLRERLDVAKVVTRRKISAQQGAPKEYLDELAAQADFILSGLGD